MIELRGACVGVLLVVAGCQGPQQELEQYRQDMCACKDAKCVQAVDDKYEAVVHRPATFVDKYLVTKGAEAKLRASLEAADACETKLMPSSKTCGGESGEKCPPGYRCVMPANPEITDAQGKCVIIHQDVE